MANDQPRQLTDDEDEIVNRYRFGTQAGGDPDAKRGFISAEKERRQAYVKDFVQETLKRLLDDPPPDSDPTQ